MFDVNYNLKDLSFWVDLSWRFFEILDSLFGINVDLGVMEGNDSIVNMDIDDLGVGLEFNLEMLNDVENLIFFGNKIGDSFFIWLWIWI